MTWRQWDLGRGVSPSPSCFAPAPLAYFSLAEGTEWLQGERRGSPELCRKAGQTLQPCSGPLDADVSVSVGDRADLLGWAHSFCSLRTAHPGTAGSRRVCLT